MSFLYTSSHIRNQYSRVENNTLIFVHNFNEQLEYEYRLMSKYPSLRFEDDENHPSIFNHPIFLTWNLQEVYMGHSFNNYIILNPGLCKLSLGFRFDKKIELTYGLTHITFGHEFNKPIILTPNIQHLMMKTHRYSHSIVLNKQLVELIVENYEEKPIVFSKNLKCATCNYLSNITISIFILPKSITHVDLKNISSPIIKLTKKLLCVKLNDSSYRFGFEVIANKYAFSIYLGHAYYCVQFPKSLKNLTLNMTRDTFQTTKNLNYLCLTNVKKTHNVTIEHSIKKLSIRFNTLNFLMDNLPNSIENLETRLLTLSNYTFHNMNFHTVNPPNSLKTNFL